ncbi:amino acid adenylation domain-containing protein [Streptomyces sp. NPDC053431]|uniref:amino acid adenylation domain-containing protein n=1 Tax=Streptomyces sp. NPDC053431 TaxID=3365703 RepID=UPI0037D9416A
MTRNSDFDVSSDCFPGVREGEARRFPADTGVHALVERWAESTPDAVAVACGSESLTYMELTRRANQLAHHFIGLGIKRGNRVGVRLPRGIDAVVAFLAAWKAGAAYVPIDPSYPQERLRYLQEDCDAALVLDADLLAASAPSIAAQPGRAPDVNITGRDLAYIIYTSGSTGQPKGVQIEHRSIANLVTGCTHLQCAPGSRILQAASISFDAATYEIWLALTSGAQLIPVPQHMPSSADLANLVRGFQVTHAFLAMPLFHRQVDEQPGSLSNLHVLVAGGEAMSPTHAKAALDTAPNMVLINSYGPSEATVEACFHVVAAGDLRHGTVPIGRPAANVRAVVLNAQGQPVPVGVEGELYLGGPGLARGYHNRPDLTAQRFVTDPFSNAPQARLYRTGDVVRWRADGLLEFCGRVDQQIKLHGVRIEPGEVEHVLRQHPGIGQTVVVRREDRPGRPYLAAYYTTTGICGPTPGALRSHAARYLPSHSIPAAFTELEALPLTTHGKVDISALPVPPKARDAGHGEMVGPRSPLEADLITLWQEALDIPEASIHDGFIALGGGSLEAMRIAAAVGKRFGVQVPLSLLLPQGTIADLAEFIDGAATDTTRHVTPIPQVARSGGVPATAGQHGLWFHDQAHPGSAVYSEIAPLRLRGIVDVGVLRRCVEQLVARHEPLRTALILEGDRLTQHIRPEAKVVLAEVELAGLEDGERETALAQVVRQLVGQPCDLARGPHLRAHLIRMGELDHLLVLSMHHAAMDGWSANILFAELAELYRALASGRQPALDPLQVQYADFAAWQHQQLEQGGFEEEAAYWRRQLAGVSERLELPADMPRPEYPSGQGALARTRLPRTLLTRIDKLARETGTTRYMVLLAAFQLLLARHTATDDIVVGTPASGRTHPDLDRAVGYFITMLPLRTRINTGISFRDLLARVRTTVLDAYAHQQLPFPALVQACGIETDSLTPLVQAALVPEDVYAHAFTLGDQLDAEFEYHDLGIAKYDLTLALIPDTGSDGLRINTEYRTDLFHPATIERFLGHLHTLLESATLTPDAPVGQLEILSKAERAQLCGGFDGPTQDFPSTGVHDLVARWAKDTPNAVAVTAADTSESLTYAQLEERANRLARYLAERGADPGTRIGVRLPRGIDAVVTFLAILKTGAAYVPLDPAHPRERLEYMTRDAGLVLEVTPGLLQRDAAVIAACLMSAPAVAWRADDVAYVIYTSGSTGLPKGVEVTHRNVVDLVVGAGYARLSAGMRHLHAASTSFDMATFEIWATLITGGRLIVAPSSAMTTHQFGELIRTQEITHAHLPTALFHRRVEEDPACLKGLHTVMVGGEALKAEHASAALRANPGLRLINGYGPTETTVYATYHVLTDPERVPSPVPIGRPTPNTRIRILDQDLRPVPVGIPGELYLGGPGLAAGYLDRPELTAERFIPYPGDPSERLYRTGDLVSWNTDGTLAYRGRIDDQVKLHGYRIEPGEIETVLHTHPGISAVHVVRREDDPGRPYLAAYYITRGTTVPPAELTDLAAARLPSYMVPRVWIALERLPLTSNGKIDRAALPTPPSPATPAPQASTSEDLEEAVATIWRSVIMADAIGPNERLFDIGGASLHVAGIHQAAREKFDLPGLYMRDLFAHPTIRTYAQHIRNLLSKNSARRTP